MVVRQRREERLRRADAAGRPLACAARPEAGGAIHDRPRRSPRLGPPASAFPTTGAQRAEAHCHPCSLQGLSAQGASPECPFLRAPRRLRSTGEIGPEAPSPYEKSLWQRRSSWLQCGKPDPGRVPATTSSRLGDAAMSRDLLQELARRLRSVGRVLIGMDGWIHGWMDRSADGSMSGPAHGYMPRQIDGSMGQWARQ